MRLVRKGLQLYSKAQSLAMSHTHAIRKMLGYDLGKNYNQFHRLQSKTIWRHSGQHASCSLCGLNYNQENRKQSIWGGRRPTGGYVGPERVLGGQL